MQVIIDKTIFKNSVDSPCKGRSVVYYYLCWVKHDSTQCLALAKNSF